jgi:lipopolysaccharide export system permease protein
LSSELKPAALSRNPSARARAADAGTQVRWLRWTILDRYVTHELVGPFLFGIAAFTSIFVAGQFLFKLTSFVAMGVPLLQVLALFGLKLVPMIVLTFPMAALLATLLAYGRLSGDSEITAMAAGGIPFMRIAVPAFWLGLVVSFVGFGINEVIAPSASRASSAIEAAITRTLAEKGLDASFVAPGKAVVIQDFEGGQLSRIVLAMGFDLATKTLHEVTIIQLTKGGPGQPPQPTQLLRAREAIWEKDREWVLVDMVSQAIKSATSAGTPRDTRRMPAVVTSKRLTYTTINKTPDQVLTSQKQPEDMSFRELRAYLAAIRDQSVDSKALRSLEVDLYNKTAIPFASLVFTLVGTPLALRRLRGGTSVGLGLSVLIIFSYYIVWHGMTIMAQGGHLSPVLASWAANLVGLLVGGVLIARAAS